MAGAMTPNSEKLTGEIAWYNAEKRFGFIKVSGREQQVFVHQNDLVDSGIAGPLTKGSWVSFRIGTSKRDTKPCAVDVQIVPAKAKAA